MKKMLLTAIAAVCLTGSITIAEDFISNEEFNQVMNEWIEFNGGRDPDNKNFDKEAIWGVVNEIFSTVQDEFPMDPELQKTVRDLRTEQYEVMDAKAKENGYESFKEAIDEHSDLGDELRAMENDYNSRIQALTTDYYEELENRYHTTCAEALQRLMNNAEKMK